MTSESPRKRGIRAILVPNPLLSKLSICWTRIAVFRMSEVTRLIGQPIPRTKVRVGVPAEEKTRLGIRRVSSPNVFQQPQQTTKATVRHSFFSKYQVKPRKHLLNALQTGFGGRILSWTTSHLISRAFYVSMFFLFFLLRPGDSSWVEFMKFALTSLKWKVDSRQSKGLQFGPTATNLESYSCAVIPLFSED